MNKIKRIKSTVKDRDITKGKIYEVTKIRLDWSYFLDDAGDENCLYKSQYEEVKNTPVMVYAYDDIDLGNVELELVHDLGEEFEYRYVCKDVNGEITGWREIGYVKKTEPEPDVNEFKHDFEVMKHDFEAMKLQMREVLRVLNEKI